MANPVWFDEAYFAGQKVLQAQAMGQTVPGDVDPVTWLSGQIVAWNSDPANADKQVAGPDYAYSNFEACNAFPRYDTAAVLRDQVNVSPNELFNVAYYLSAAADSANASGYTAGGVAAGSWTAEAVLKHMYDDNGYTAWEHFKNAGIEQELDCSDKFSTSKYIDLKAEYLGEDRAVVKQELLASGLNPVEDFYESGMDEVITDMTQLQPDKAPAAAIMADSDVWGTGVTPPAPVDVDPYEVDVVPHVIEAGDNGPYEGEAGVNTQFEATWLAGDAGTTLSPDARINGGEGGKNTLQVEMGKDWDGFSGIAPEDDLFAQESDYEPSVTNVGRVVINRQNGITSQSETPLNFNAKFMDGVERFDLNASGTGATSLSELQSSVKTVNISGLQDMDAGGNKGYQTTAIDYAARALAGNDDSLTIGLKSVGSADDRAPVTFTKGIETVTVNSISGTHNGVNIKDSTGSGSGVRTLNIKGGTDITLDANAEGISVINAGEATGNVNMQLYGMNRGSHVVTGGSGRDNVTLYSTGTVDAAGWTGVESVTLQCGDSSTNVFDMRNSADITDIYVADKGTYAVSNAFGPLTVYQNSEDSNGVTVNGYLGDNKLQDIKWLTNATADDAPVDVKGKFTSNATGTVTIETTDDNYIKGGSEFKFANAKTVNINQKCAANDSATPYSTGVTVDAANATALTVEALGALKITGTNQATALASVQTLKADLKAAGANTAAGLAVPDSFDMSGVDLVALQSGVVNAGGENVTFGKIGSTSGKGFTLQIDEANDVELGAMSAGLGTINVDINYAQGEVKLNGDITNTTNAVKNGVGNIVMDIDCDGALTVTGGAEINGGQVNIDFTGVGMDLAPGTGAVGAAGAGNALNISAQANIVYQGSLYGNDYVAISGIGSGSGVPASSINTNGGNDMVRLESGAMSAGSRLNVNTGAGDDEVVLTSGSLGDKSIVTVDLGSGTTDKVNVDATAVVSGGAATLNVICGAGADALDVKASTTGKLVVYVDGFEFGVDKVSGFVAGTITSGDEGQAATNLNAAFGLKLTGVGKLVTVDGEQGYYEDGKLYVASGVGTTGALVVVQGVSLDDGLSFDLNGNGAVGG